MSLTIISYMHVLCRGADLAKMHFSRYNHPHILCMCSNALQSDNRLKCDIEISGKTQNYRLKSVCNFKVTRFQLILPCKQHNWTSGTYSIEIIHPGQLEPSITRYLPLIRRDFCFPLNHLLKKGTAFRNDLPINRTFFSRKVGVIGGRFFNFLLFKSIFLENFLCDL